MNRELQYFVYIIHLLVLFNLVICDVLYSSHHLSLSIQEQVYMCVCVCEDSLTFSWYCRRDESSDWMRAVAWPTNMA